MIGDTTTTMMWISGVPPIEVLHAYIAAAVAFLVFASRQRARSSALRLSTEDAKTSLADRLAARRHRLFILASAVAVNVGGEWTRPDMS